MKSVDINRNNNEGVEVSDIVLNEVIWYLEK